VLASGLAVVRWRRSRPAGWVEQVTRSVERAGRKAGRRRRPSETFSEYADALDQLSGGDARLLLLAQHVEVSAYGGREPPPERQRELVLMARRTRLDRRSEAGSADATEARVEVRA